MVFYCKHHKKSNLGKNRKANPTQTFTQILLSPQHEWTIYWSSIFTLIGTVAVMHENIEEPYAYYHIINCPESTGTSLSSCFNVGSRFPCDQAGGVICKGNLHCSSVSIILVTLYIRTVSLCSSYSIAVYYRRYSFNEWK